MAGASGEENKHHANPMATVTTQVGDVISSRNSLLKALNKVGWC